MIGHGVPVPGSAEPADLRPVQLAWLAAAVFVVSAGYGALMPLLPGWLASMMPAANASEIARHVGFLSGVYAAGVRVGAPLREAKRCSTPGHGGRGGTGRVIRDDRRAQPDESSGPPRGW